MPMTTLRILPLAAFLLLACACTGTGTPAAGGGWQALPFDPAFAAWRNHAGWVNAGAAGLRAGNPHFLDAAPGVGLAVNGATGNCPDLVSAAEFGDCEVHVEFMVGSHSNSGVYVMGRYEVQIWDSFGADRHDYDGIECGGVYPRWVGGRHENGHSPRTNAARRPGEWQTFDIRFRAPRFDAAGRKTADAVFERVVHNGVLVQEQVDLTGPTHGGHPDEKAAGPLRLQGDHGPVAYRNLRIRPLPAR